MRFRTALISVVLLVGLVELTPALFFAETGVLSAESKIFKFIGVEFFTSLFGL